MKSIKAYLSYLYYEKKWRFYIRQFMVYFKGLFTPTRHPKVKFIVFAQGRTGSTILVDLINQSADVHCDQEIFGGSMPIRVLFPKFYKRSLRSFNLKPIYGYRIKIYELTMFQGHTESSAIEAMRKEFSQGYKIIYLHRENKFRQAMSSLVAEARGQFHDKTKGDIKRQKVCIDHTAIPHRIELLNDFTTWEQRALEGFEHLSISYEKDLLIQENHQSTLDKITNYLGSKKATAQSAYKRSSSDDMSEYIENYDEVIEILKSSNNMHFLEG